MREFWSDEEDSQGHKAHWKRLRRGGGQRKSRAPGLMRSSGQGRARHNIITHYNAITQVLSASAALHVHADTRTSMFLACTMMLPLLHCQGL
jgi:hypothetical protein